MSDFSKIRQEVYKKLYGHFKNCVKKYGEKIALEGSVNFLIPTCGADDKMMDSIAEHFQRSNPGASVAYERKQEQFGEYFEIGIHYTPSSDEEFADYGGLDIL